MSLMQCKIAILTMTWVAHIHIGVCSLFGPQPEPIHALGDSETCLLESLSQCTDHRVGCSTQHLRVRAAYINVSIIVSTQHVSSEHTSM